jgi:hypothetical protein
MLGNDGSDVNDGSGGKWAIRSEGLVVNIRDPNNGKLRGLGGSVQRH